MEKLELNAQKKASSPVPAMLFSFLIHGFLIFILFFSPGGGSYGGSSYSGELVSSISFSSVNIPPTGALASEGAEVKGTTENNNSVDINPELPTESPLVEEKLVEKEILQEKKLNAEALPVKKKEVDKKTPKKKDKPQKIEPPKAEKNRKNNQPKEDLKDKKQVAENKKKSKDNPSSGGVDQTSKTTEQARPELAGATGGTGEPGRAGGTGGGLKGASFMWEGLEVYNAKDTMVPPSVLRAVKPDYPVEAKSRKLQGKVMVKMVVDCSGSPKACQVYSAQPQGYFEDSAIKAAYKMRFKPGQINGRAVQTLVVIPFLFELH